METKIRNFEVPDFAMFVLIGASGSGKTTFAHKHFSKLEILSSDQYREVVSDDADSLDANSDAFAVLHMIANKRLARRLSVVVDATSLRVEDREGLLKIASAHHAPCIAIMLDVSDKTCLARNAKREKPRPVHVLKRMFKNYQETAKNIRYEAFTSVLHIVEKKLDTVTFTKRPLNTDLTKEKGAFDVIGDVHGCYTELKLLLEEMGYCIENQDIGLEFFTNRSRQTCMRNLPVLRHPEGRRAIFVGDLVDRGPDSLKVLELVMASCLSGYAFCARGNHEQKLLKWLRDKPVTDNHGFLATRTELESLKEQDSDLFYVLKEFLENTSSHLVLDNERLIVTHAGIRDEMIKRASKQVMDFCLYGETTGERDSFDLPIRLAWTSGYSKDAKVVWGHVAHKEPNRIGNTICIDTGCVFGGFLTAYRYPEDSLVSVPAQKVWFTPLKPLEDKSQITISGDKDLQSQFGNIGKICETKVDVKNLHTQDLKTEIAFKVNSNTSIEELDTMPDVGELLGKRVVMTRFSPKPIKLTSEQTASAFEAFARFGADPRWVVHVPPTTSTVEASRRGEWLEYPEEACWHYAKANIEKLWIQEKHMGSRAVVLVCRDLDTAKAVFYTDTLGAVLTRNGRPFLPLLVEEAFIEKANNALTENHFWENYKTNWVILDGEMLPWSIKGQNLITEVFATTASTMINTSHETIKALSGSTNVSDIINNAEKVLKQGQALQKAYTPYVGDWDGSVSSIRFAIFHVLATSEKTFHDTPHSVHMMVADALSRISDIFIKTRHRVFNPQNADEVDNICRWWEELIEQGVEGAVIKPSGLLGASPNGRVAPSIKVRGREYLRLIYGPGYDDLNTLGRLKNRETGRKRKLAQQGSLLGQESLALLVDGASLARIHKTIMAGLALSESLIDGRL